MRKTRLILIVAVIALLAVGGAYAAWTSRVTISANASAGEMDVQISSIVVGQVSEHVEFETDSISISEDKKSATVSIKNLYPGAEANTTIVVTNIGTIPVMLSNASQVRELAVNTETNQDLSTIASNMLVVKYTATADTKSGQVKISDSSSEANASIFQNTGIVIEAGKTIEFSMQITMDKDAPDETENTLFQFQFIPIFVQPNLGSSGSESVNEAPAIGAPATSAPATEEPVNQNETVSEGKSSALEGLTMQNNGMLGAWNGSEEYSGDSKDIVIPSTLDDIDIIRVGQNTFREKGLVSVNFEEGSQIERIHARAFQSNHLTEIVLPDSLSRIDTRAFYDNPISTVIIPDGVTTIENNAFSKLTKITVGNNLTDLKDGAINGNNAFRDAYLSEKGGSGTYIWDGKNWIKS